MPNEANACGSELGSKPPSLVNAFTIGCGLPTSFADPASARNSRCRENQATIIEAAKPNTIWQTMTVTV